MAIDELAPGSSHERQARAMDRLDPFEVTMLRGAALALRRRADRQSKIDEAGTMRGDRGVLIRTGEAVLAGRLGRFSEMTTISTQGLIPEQELIKRPIAVEVGGVVHQGHYSTRNGMIRVTYGSSCKATQLGGMENAPKALARIILAEQVREALGHNEAED